MINQLTLGVGLKDEATFANYYSSKNSPLIHALKNSAEGAGFPFIYFYGAGGQGCTHLLQACCHAANENNIRSVYIPLLNIKDFTPEIFEDLETLKLICIDDLQMLAGNKIWEEAFFHAFNRIKDAGSHLIIAAKALPKALNLLLPDLSSRLTWGVTFQIEPLDDLEKLHVLIKRAERRGMSLSEEVGKFILTHCPRHMSTLFAALDALDKMSLAAQRKLTIPFVKKVLEI